MKKIILRKSEVITDVHFYEAEISSEDFPEILAEDFDIDECSEELDEALHELDWDHVENRIGDPDISFFVKG